MKKVKLKLCCTC